MHRLIDETGGVLIHPESLAFNYLTNSSILQFFLGAGVKLDLFFRLLWRHVFTIELLKKRYDLGYSWEKQSFLDRIGALVTRDTNKEKAIQYLLQWSDQFWENAEYRIKEIVHKVEKDLTASVKGKFNFADFGADRASKLSDEEKVEVVQRGMNVINSIQMKELTDVLTFLNEDVFADEKQKYFVCIDRLDENWVDDNFRYLLIRSLIETIRDFLQVRNVKIVTVLRTDLIERVFKFTRDPGFQEEKYRSLYLNIRWTESQLLEVLDKRVDFMVRQTYTKKPVRYTDILPSRLGREGSGAEYLISRTLMRPRDLIEFFNSVLEHAPGKPAVTKEMILDGEGVYSKLRMRSLQDEWQADYPTLIAASALLKKRPSSFRLNAISQEETEEFCLNLSIAVRPANASLDLPITQARGVVEGIVSWEIFLCSLIHIFYITGLVGLKTDAFESYQWSNEGPSTIVADTISLDTGVSIHPMFYRVLGVKPAG